jgi:2-polyprenyl-3-methyl-5-hydroxy-6-metoxy-1,4-benzoquinol methylase
MADDVAIERDAFAERLHASALGFFDVLSIRLGDRLGLYAALAEGGGVTSTELADRAGIAERYAREWLEQQTAAGIVRADGIGGDTIRFSLPVGHAEVLLDRDSLSYMAPTIRALMTLTPVMDGLVDAYRSGGGVSWDAYGTDARESVGDSNRPIYLQVLPRDWLPKIPEIHDRLRTAPPARVADIGCGTGWSSIAIAGAYPGVRVDGFDRDEESLAFARRNAETSGVADRVSFQARDAGEPGDAGAYDVVTFFECLHDMSRPVDALRVARGLLNGGGVVFVADEPTNDEFTGAEDDLDRYHYGWSLFACLPTAMSEPGSAGTGTVMRPSTLRSYAREAGFTGCDVLPIEDDSFRLYLLRP